MDRARPATFTQAPLRPPVQQPSQSCLTWLAYTFSPGTHQGVERRNSQGRKYWVVKAKTPGRRRVAVVKSRGRGRSGWSLILALPPVFPFVFQKDWCWPWSPWLCD